VRNGTGGCDPPDDQAATSRSSAGLLWMIKVERLSSAMSFLRNSVSTRVIDSRLVPRVWAMSTWVIVKRCAGLSSAVGEAAPLRSVRWRAMSMRSEDVRRCRLRHTPFPEFYNGKQSQRHGPSFCMIDLKTPE